jgi:acyl carrier protein
MDRQSKILEIVQAVARKDEAPGLEDSLFDSGYLDSFGLPDLVAELEKAFSVKIPDSDLSPRKFESVARIEEYLQSRQ